MWDREGRRTRKRPRSRWLQEIEQDLNQQLEKKDEGENENKIREWIFKIHNDLMNLKVAELQ